MAAPNSFSAGFIMTSAAHIRGQALCMVLLAVLFPWRALCSEVHVYLSNADHISGKELSLDERSLTILTPHCGRVVIERSAVKGLSSDPERAREILDFSGESDVVHNANGDRLTGRVVEIKDDGVFVKAFFADDKLVNVEVEQLDYLVFASEKKAERTAEPDEVRVIFINGDVVSGQAVGLEAGQFILDPPYCEKVRFDTDAFRSLHNARHSKEFLEGGIAQAIVDVLERSSESGAVSGDVYIPLITSFLKDGDKKGALLIFRRSTARIRNQHVFQVIGDQFLANDMLDAAVEAYEKMLEKSPTYYYAYSKLFNAYVKAERYSKAAEIYERLLSTPSATPSRYGTSMAKIRMDLSDVYIKLETFDKASEQLRLVIADQIEKQETRDTALSKLIGLFRQQGTIGALVEKYEADLAANNKVIGEGYLDMVNIYVDEGKIMKAKGYVERLDEIGLKECAEKARQLIGE